MRPTKLLNLKHLLLVTISLFSILSCFAQSYTTPIDVTVNSIYGDEIGALKLKSSTTNQFMYAAYLDQFSSGVLQVIKPGLGVQDLLLNPQGGNIGIGTVSPTSLLHVAGTANFRSNTTTDGYLSINKGSSTTQGYIGWWKPGNNRVAYMGYNDGSSYNNLGLTLEGADFIINGGNVGIGTNNPRGYQLAVNGKIRAYEIKVEASPWPDYVFKSDYQLTPLADVEKHIKEKGHLPGIPSAEEVKANGIDLGETNAKLLQKIEELTLYLIEIKKESLKDRVLYLEKKL